MTQVPAPYRTRSRVPARTGPRLAGALVLAGSLLVAGCSSAATPSASPPASPSASSAGAADLQNDFIGVVDRVSPSVVVIETSSGLGSGVVFDGTGDIVTNNHVVEGSTKFAVTLSDGQKLDGTLVGTYPAGDLAVIHVTGANLTPATFGDSSKLVVGDLVMAIGNPLGLDSSVTQGIVSAVGRDIPESSSVKLTDVIQTSAEINPGNSGGALVDLGGNVVGMPTLTELDPQIGGAAAGIGFAIPSNTVVDVADQLIANGRVVTPPAPAASASPAPS
jgi:putative serine protease PepD